MKRVEVGPRPLSYYEGMPGGEPTGTVLSYAATAAMEEAVRTFRPPEWLVIAEYRDEDSGALRFLDYAMNPSWMRDVAGYVADDELLDEAKRSRIKRGDSIRSHGGVVWWTRP